MRFFRSTEYELYSGCPTGFKSLYLLQLCEKNNVIIFIEDEEEREIVKEELHSFPHIKPLDYQGNITVHAIHDNRNYVIFVHSQDELREAEKILSSVTFRTLKLGDKLDVESLFDHLTELGYKRVGFVEEKGEFARRGGIIDIFPMGEKEPYRIELWGDRVYSIRIFDVDTQRSVKKVKEIVLEGVVSHGKGNNFKVVVEKLGVPPYRVSQNAGYVGNINLLLEEIKKLKARGFRVLFFTTASERKENFEEILGCEVLTGKIFNGFIFEEELLAVFSEAELRGYVPRRRHRGINLGEKIEDYTLLIPGDYVVHIDYGIGKFTGLERIKFGGVTYECMRIEYKDGVVSVPIHNLHKVERFTRESDTPPPLSSLSDTRWRTKRLKAEIGAIRFAKEILKIHALRRKKRGYRYMPVPEIEFKIWSEFPYEETEGQRKAIEDVLNDLESEKIMDRLVAGEVGFGKTEVALRAAVRVVLNGKQTILLVPTTILALQHYRNFAKRLENYPINVKMLSRLTTESEKKEILKGLEDGTVDIVIGTHALLGDNVKFKDPGLLIIDEEHRFGVEAKEALRKKFPLIDTLRLTATPIPRTLNMSLGKVYDLSIIETPPPGRESVETIVTRFDEKVIKEAIKREIERGGKVFFIHNRIKTIRNIEKMLREFFPELNIQVAHGRMPRSRLEDIYINFYEGKYDILLSTAIIEAGVDFPEANTIIVDNAHLFGLAELHQLRGRVGRGMKKGYAYFLVPKRISSLSKRRLKALEKYSHLGAGFKIALKDMEIRGAGNILGKEQHGFVNMIGFDLFFKLLEEAFMELEGKKVKKFPEVILKTDAFIPGEYMEDDEIRLSFYKRISEIKDLYEINEVKEELEDRFGPVPAPLEELLEVVKMKLLLSEVDVDRIVVYRSYIEVFKNGKLKKFSREIPVENLIALL